MKNNDKSKNYILNCFLKKEVRNNSEGDFKDLLLGQLIDIVVLSEHGKCLSLPNSIDKNKYNRKATFLLKSFDEVIPFNVYSYLLDPDSHYIIKDYESKTIVYEHYSFFQRQEIKELEKIAFPQKLIYQNYLIEETLEPCKLIISRIDEQPFYLDLELAHEILEGFNMLYEKKFSIMDYEMNLERDKFIMNLKYHPIKSFFYLKKHR